MPRFIAAILGVAIVAIAAGAQAQTPSPTPSPSQPVPAISVPLSAVPVKPDFGQWLADFETEAKGKGITDATLVKALTGIQPIDKVLDFDRRQPEFTLTLDAYLAHTVTPERIAKGKALYAQHRKVLLAVQKKYKVPAKYVVALWGIESGFGAAMGGYPVVPALATLAYDGRRSQYFRTELLNALQIVDRGATPQQMTGSWAGAMGQCQFMPSAYLKYAQRWQGDGPPDIWANPDDVFASAANYLATVGWDEHQSWGRPVRLTAHVDDALIGPGVKKTVAEWARLGLRQADGKPLPRSAIMASLVRADPGRDKTNTGPPFLIYDNFRTLLNWNRSIFFAVAAGTLADSIASR